MVRARHGRAGGGVMYEISDLEPLVKNGAELLDKIEPRWFHVFNEHRLKNLNAADEYTDVLGYVFGSWHTGVQFLGLTTLEIETYGFDLPDWAVSNEYNWDSDPWIDLTCLWEEEIVDRLENGTPND